jgi:hypothetical protein
MELIYLAPGWGFRCSSKNNLVQEKFTGSFNLGVWKKRY